MAVDPKAVPVFLGNFLLHLDINQVQRLLMADKIVRCPDTSKFEHYHFNAATLNGAYLSTKAPINLASASDEQLDAVQASVNALIDKAMKG